MGTKSHPAKQDNSLPGRISGSDSEWERVDVMARRKTYHLDDMLTQITSENRHPEWDTGLAQGKEEW